MNIKQFEPSPEYLEWLKTVHTLSDIQSFMNNWKWTSDWELYRKLEYIDTPNEVFEKKKSDCDGIAILFADAAYRALGHKTYVISVWKFILKWPFYSGHTMMIDFDGAWLRLVNYWEVFPMTKLWDIEAVRKTGYSHVWAIYSIPDGKKIKRL